MGRNYKGNGRASRPTRGEAQKQTPILDAPSTSRWPQKTLGLPWK
jgi:hypothetical protein